MFKITEFIESVRSPIAYKSYIKYEFVPCKDFNLTYVLTL